MRIDVRSPDGNVFAALGIATQMLRKVDAPKEEIDGLKSAVLSAKSYEEACAAITDATNGAIEFYDSSEE